MLSLSFLPCRELPDRRTFELVPGAPDLGLMICSVEGRVVVSQVKAYSIAGEDGKVERGDVIDELGRVAKIQLIYFHGHGSIQGDPSPRYKLPIDLVVTVVAAAGPSLWLPTACARWWNITNPSEGNVF